MPLRLSAQLGIALHYPPDLCRGTRRTVSLCGRVPKVVLDVAGALGIALICNPRKSINICHDAVVDVRAGVWTNARCEFVLAITK